MNKITSEQFLEAWCNTWKAKDTNCALSNQFSGDGTWTKWTEAMLTSENAFLKCVGKKLGIKECNGGRMSQEDGGYYRIDMAFIADDNKGYPRLIDVMIEHENQKDVENEMWKLIFLRSPLKVIVFYGHSDNSFKSMSPEANKISLQEKLNELLNMLYKCNNAFTENENTEYLFVIGSVQERGAKMQWRWASTKNPKLTELC